jgi:FlaA1/EpsC-like NDP-sugar epimerase
MAGFVPEKEIPIVYTGLRPGEKLQEQLLTEEEEQTQTVRNRIKVASSPAPPRDLQARLAELRKVAQTGDRGAVLAALGALVPSYRDTGRIEQPALPELELPLAPVYDLPLAASDRPRAGA